MSDTLIPVNVFIAGRSYRVRVPAEEEAAVRRAVKAADEKIADLRRHYAGKDDQDFVAMALLMYATDTASAGTQLMRDDLREMIAQIENVIVSEVE